jgi:hypothetical protein
MLRHLLVAALVALFVTTSLAQGPSERGGQSAGTPSTLELLNRRVPDVDFTDTPLTEILEWLGNFTGANIRVRWQLLQDAGVDPYLPVTIKAKNMRLSQLLWQLMNEVGGTDLKLAYRAEGDRIILSSEEDLRSDMVIQIYDLRDMMVGVLRAEAPEMDASQAMQGTGGGGGGATSLFGGQRGGQRNRRGDDAQDPELQRIIQMIQNSIEPSSWQVSNGRGTINEFNGMLIIYNSPLVHQQIGGFIMQEDLSAR